MPKYLPMILVLLGLFLFAAPVFAASPGPYLEVEGLGSWPNDSRNQSASGTFNASFKQGHGWGIALGYDLVDAYPDVGTGRVELEAADRQNDFKKLEFVDGKPPASGKLEIKSLLCNTFAEYHSPSIWTPYVGLGAGYAEVSVDQVTAAGVPFIAASKDQVFAFQVGCGVGLALGDHLTLDLGYRYFATLQPELKLADGGTFKTRIGVHNVLLGLRLKY